jgi:predicted RNA-binding protein (virulence factor B family)
MNELVGQFTILPVISITSFGAYLNWGEPKDLLLPSSEQIQRLQLDDLVAVYIFIDNQDRPCASMRLERFISKEVPVYKVDEPVDLLIFQETELGFKAIINQKHLGLLYKNEIFTRVDIATEVKGYVKKVRDDQKIDLNLRAAGHEANIDITENILSQLSQNKGFLPIDDKTEADQIYELFGVSKKKYKMALGALYKKRLIRITPEGIYLTSNPS